MRLSTIVFELLIGNEYFPGYKITKPFYCTVSYEYNESSDKHRLLSVTFSGNTLEAFRNNGNFYEEVNMAILNNIESNKNREEEIRAVLDEVHENYKSSISY